MEKVVPVLQIDNGDQAKAFYVDGLGFELDFEWRHEPGFPVFMGVKKCELYLHLSEHGKGHKGSEIYVFVDDIASWHEKFQVAGIPMEQGPQQMPWGNTELPISDPFRNLLRFTQIDTHAPAAASA